MTEVLRVVEEPNGVIEAIKELGMYDEYLAKQGGYCAGDMQTVDVASPPKTQEVQRTNVEEPVARDDIKGDGVACKDEDPEVFFPKGERSPSALHKIRIARAICLGCVALEKCRAYALQNKEPYGIWGGMTEGEREKELNKAAQKSV